MDVLIHASARLMMAVASVLLVGTPSWAQTPLPCSVAPLAGRPACDDDGRSPPVTLEPLFDEVLERSPTWSASGEVVWQDGGLARLSAGSAIGATIPLTNRGDPLVTFDMASRGLAVPHGAVVVDYFDGSAWRPLASTRGSRELARYKFWLRDVANAAEFKLRFRVIGPDGYAHVDNVSIWAPRIVPPPVFPP